MTTLINQPDSAPTRKVTAATFGAALGAAVGNLSDRVAELSPWLEWLGEPDVRFLVVSVFASAGALVAGYFVRERAT